MAMWCKEMSLGAMLCCNEEGADCLHQADRVGGEKVILPLPPPSMLDD
jgi:hypothetical protein